MRQRDFICSLILLTLAGVAFWEVSRVPIGTPMEPQMGFYPLILAILLTILSLNLLWQTIKTKEQEKSTADRGRGGLHRVALTLGALFVFTFLFEFLGYIISLFLLTAFLMRVIESQTWWKVIAVALLCSLGSFLIFGLLLDTTLPQGILGIWRA